jgi:TPR repeat protein
MLKKIGMLVLFSTLISGCASSSGGLASHYNERLNHGWDALQRQDYKTAHESFLQIAAWDSRAQVKLGVMHQKGLGVPQDYKEAVRWFRHSTEHKNAYGQYNLGWMYANGQGVPQDYKEAVRWFRLSADQGFADAQNNLGLMYKNGTGVPQDYKEAVRLYRLAVDQGHAQAQFNLGLSYGRGKGVPQDFVLAYMWLNLAGSYGSQRIKSKIDLVKPEKYLTPQQLEKAQELVRNWKIRYEDQLKRQAYADQQKRQAYEDQQKRQAYENQQKKQELRQTIKQLSEGLTQFGEEQRRRSTTNAYKYKPPTLSYDSNTSSGYRSSFGSTYEYDLSKPLDRQRYRVDPKAKLRDRLGINPQRRIERNIGQYGGGVLNNNKGAQW